MCTGTTTGYSSNGNAGGTWSSSNTVVATVDPSSGVVSALTAGTTNIVYTVSSGCNNPVSSFNTVQVNVCLLTLNIRMFIQGFYNGNLSMKPVWYNSDGPLHPNNYPQTITDFVYVSLVDIALPHSTLFADWGILNTDGTMSISTIPASLLNQPVALKINHRNSIETWSSGPVTLGLTTFFDFSSSSLSAFQENMFEIEPNVWTIYNGDIDQNGVIELGDYAYMDYYIPHQINGYVVTDLDGDGATTSGDYGVLDFNAFYAIGVAAPW
jgi:hypothetical protein